MSRKEILNKRVIIMAAIDIAFLMVSLYMLLFSLDNPISDYSFIRGDDRFMDFFNHIAYCQKMSDTYYVNYNANFPPFAYLFYKFINIILPSGTVVMWTANQTGAAGLLVFVVYNILLFSFVMYNVLMYCDAKKQSFLLFMLFLLSYPAVFGIIERGNAAGIVLVLLLAAFRLRDSESKLDREGALWLIAMAAGFKVYPAIMGVMYLIERRFREAIRLFVYGVVVFFLPFIFLGGGEGFLQFINNQLTLHSGSTYSSISVAGISQHIFSDSNHKLISVIISVALVAILIVTFFLVKNTWKRVAVLVGIMTLIPKWSQNYTLSYYFVPLVLYINESCGDLKAEDYCYSIIFAFINSLFLVPLWIDGLLIGEWLSIIGAYSLPIVILCEVLVCTRKNRRLHLREKE